MAFPPAMKKLLYIAFAGIGLASSLLLFGLSAKPISDKQPAFTGPPPFLRIEFNSEVSCNWLVHMNADGLGCFITLYHWPQEEGEKWIDQVKEMRFFQIADPCRRQIIFEELDALAMAPDTTKRHCADAAKVRIFRNGELLQDNNCSGGKQFWRIMHPIRDFVGKKDYDC